MLTVRTSSMVILHLPAPATAPAGAPAGATATATAYYLQIVLQSTSLQEIYYVSTRDSHI